MDPNRPTGKRPPTPSRRSTETGAGGRHSNPHPAQTSSNSGRGTTGDEDYPLPQEDSNGRPKPTPPSPRTTSTQNRAVPLPILASSSACTPRIPGNLDEVHQLICVPVAQLADLCRQCEVSGQLDGQQAAGHQPSAFVRQSTYTQDRYSEQNAYGQQEACQQEHPGPPDKMSPEIDSQRSKCLPSGRAGSRIPPKFQTKQQRTAGTTMDRPPWRGASRNTCKPPSVYPEPHTPLPPVSKSVSAVTSVRQHRSESQMSARDYQMSAKQSQISARQSQASAKQNQTSTRQSQASVKQSQLSQNSTKQSHGPSPADTGQASQTRQNSQLNFATPAVAPQELTQLPDDVRVLSPARSNGNFHVDVPPHKSSERFNVQYASDEDQARRPLSRPIHFEDDNVRVDADNIVCTVGPNRGSSERIHEECETIMQKLTAELALSGKFSPTDRLCVRVSLGEHLTSDGQRKSYTICEPPLPLPADQPQDDGTEIYATPMAASPRVSLLPDGPKPNASIPEALEREASGHEVLSVHEEPEQPTKQKERLFPSTEEVLPPNETLPASFEEILPPPTETEADQRLQEIAPSPTKKQLSPPSKPVTPLPAAEILTVPPEPGAKPKEHPQKEPPDHRDKESNAGIQMKTVENEALNTEFLYYSSVLKNLLPVLSCPEDRCCLVPWVKKLFSPEYCARLLRDKRNRFLLHLALVLCNDEVIGVFRKPPPEGTMPSVDELCSTRYPPAAWECDSAWLDHLEDIPPGVARMPCPWHASGCPAPADTPTAATGSNEGPTCPQICYPWRQQGTSNETSFGWSLDQEFKLLLYLSRPLKPLMKISRDRQRLVAWLRFLSTVTPDCCVALRLLRNDYAKLLLAYCQDDRMTGPFASDPVWGQPLPLLGDGGDADQPRPFADPASGDVDEFLRNVPVPNEGAFCYVAVDGIPVKPITRPTASASLLQR